MVISHLNSYQHLAKSSWAGGQDPEPPAFPSDWIPLLFLKTDLGMDPHPPPPTPGWLLNNKHLPS